MTTSYYNITKTTGSLVGHSRPQGLPSKRNSPMPFDPNVLIRLLMDELTGNGRRNARRAVGCYLNPLPKPPPMERSIPLISFDESSMHLLDINSWGLHACRAPFHAQRQWVTKPYYPLHARTKAAASPTTNQVLPAPTQPKAMFEPDMWRLIVPSRSQPAPTQPKVMFEQDIWRRIVPSRSRVTVRKVSDMQGAERKGTPDLTLPSFAATPIPTTSSIPATAAIPAEDAFPCPPCMSRSARARIPAQKLLKRKKGKLERRKQRAVLNALYECRMRAIPRLPGDSSDSE